MQIFLLEESNFPYGRLGPLETRHCIKVLRHKIGDALHCIDGKGNAFEAHILGFDQQHTRLRLGQMSPAWGEHSGSIRLAVSPLRLKDRFEFMIEKAVELGVNEIFPVSCKHTEKYQAKFKVERLQTRIISATKQCKRSLVPTLHPLQNLEDFLLSTPAGIHYIAYCEDSPTPLQKEAAAIQKADLISLLIGPEGDFSAEEVQLAHQHAYQTISLGDNRLRTETAAIYGLGVIKMIRGY